MVDALQYRHEVFTSIGQAKAGLDGRTEWFVCLLDHDFRQQANEEETGYDLARWLRTQHPLREILPIIYLTGRESPRSFLQRQRELRKFAPQTYLAKSDLATDFETLPKLIAAYDDELDRYEAMCDEHGEERARYFFYGLFNE